jgi:hypothetical protein
LCPSSGRFDLVIPPARVALLAALGVTLCGSPVASADTRDEVELAERYAPVVRLVEQDEECGPGEPYEPLDVDVLFDEPTVALRGPWGARDLVEIGPAAEGLTGGLYEYHLDFPGNALDPGCDYERWARRLTEDRQPAVYAHVATDPAYPDRLALQYWLFYAYNDWNNLHEGDWEMMQLVFAAATAREALRIAPMSIGYSQHEGAERAEWGEDKLELVDGIHPVVYPAAGSHANFFEEALFLGNSAEQGVGCDDTTGPSVDVRPAVLTIPSDPAEARAAFPWIEFEGRWGELQRAFFNGPTGPNLKTQWTEPIRWSDSWRDRSYAVPGGGLFGTGATDFFCGAVAGGSTALQRLLDEPAVVLLLLATLVVLVLLLLSRATWRPAAPLRLARRRAWGQILAAASRMYVGRMPLFVGIGLLTIPISLLVTSLQTVVLGASSVVGVETEGESSGVLALLVVAIGTTLTLLGLGFVQAATVRALVEIDEGRTTGPVGAYRLALDSVLPLLGALSIAVVVVSLFASSLFLLPIAVWLAVRWTLVAAVVELEGLPALGALQRSSRLVRPEWLKVGSLALGGGALAVVAGPLVGALLIIVTDAPLWLLNVVAGVVYAVTMPFVALTTAYLYFDARARDELAPEWDPDELPAEIALGG